MIPDFTVNRQDDGSIKVEVKNISGITFFMHESRGGESIVPPPPQLIPLIFEQSVGDESAVINWRYIPGTPEITVTGKNNALDVDVTSLNTGGLAISNYEYSVGGDFEPFGSTSMPLTIPDLNNNQTYTVLIRAINSFGTGFSGEGSGTPIAVGTPSAPTITSITAQDNALQVFFTAPSSDGGSAITGYRYELDGGALVDAGLVTDDFTISSLEAREYTVRILAYNAVGDGSLSNLVSETPLAPFVPDAATTAHITRVEADGGTILNQGVTDEIIREEKARSADIHFIYDSHLGYKEASGGVLTKLYDFGDSVRDTTTFNGDPSRVSTGLEFDGNDRIPIVDGGGTVYLNTWSIAIWGRPSIEDSFMGVIGRQSPVRGVCYLNTSVNRMFYIDYDTGGADFLNVGDVGGDTVGVWRHYAWTGSTAGTVKGYMNGVEIGSVSAPKSGELNLQYIGSYGDKYFTGLMDRMGVYTKILTGAEITSMFNSSKARYGY